MLKSFESYIFRCQKADIPPLPKTVDELEKMILELKYGRKYSHDERGQIFFRGVWRGNTGREKENRRILFCIVFIKFFFLNTGDNVFVSESTLQEVRKERHLQLLMDGKFKVLPFHIKFRQLYIINVIIEERNYPLAFILMERKDTASYELIFNKIKELISSKFRNITCMTDYEAATRNAVKKVRVEYKLDDAIVLQTKKLISRISFKCFHTFPALWLTEMT